MRLPKRIPGGWPVIYADPPWAFKTYSGDKIPQRALIPHYQVMTLEDLKALDVGSLAADNAALFMYVLDSMLPEAIEVGHSWGFPKYIKVALNWCKPDMGMGYWSRNDTELCLLFTRGRPKRKDADVRQRIGAPAGKHSEKPIDTYVKIEKLIDGPYLELFAREDACAYKEKGYREGWTAWGLEAPGIANRIARNLAAREKLSEIVSMMKGGI